jgi:hypothetical protein
VWRAIAGWGRGKRWMGARGLGVLVVLEVCRRDGGLRAC